MNGQPVPEYLSSLPDAIPAGRVLVHNNVRPTRRLGSRGFRAWLAPISPGLAPCLCGWAPELGQHFTPADPVELLAALGAKFSPDLDAYAAGELDAAEVRCVLCLAAPCECPPFGTPEYFALIDRRHGRAQAEGGPG